MSYVTPAALLTAYGVRELLEACATSDPDNLVTAALLVLTIKAGARSGFTSDEIAAADAMLAALTGACSQSSAKVDSALLARWPDLTVPVSPAPTDVSRIARWIARYLMHDDITDEESNIIFRRYKDASGELRDIARGLTSLGVSPSTDEAISLVLFIVVAPAVTFTDDVLDAMP